jgi:hypothetical protein
MIALAKSMERRRPEKWYVLIAQEPNGPYRWDAIIENQYDTYQRHFVIEKGFEIIAGPYAVSRDTIDRISGFNSQKEKIGPKYLEELVWRINDGEEINAEEELRNLIRGD